MQTFRKSSVKNEEHALLKESLRASKKDYELALANFEQVVEPDLIDCYIYELNAASLRYKFLMERAREAGI